MRYFWFNNPIIIKTPQMMLTPAFFKIGGIGVYLPSLILFERSHSPCHCRDGSCGPGLEHPGPHTQGVHFPWVLSGFGPCGSDDWPPVPVCGQFPAPSRFPDQISFKVEQPHPNTPPCWPQDQNKLKQNSFKIEQVFSIFPGFISSLYVLRSLISIRPKKSNTMNTTRHVPCNEYATRSDGFLDPNMITEPTNYTFSSQTCVTWVNFCMGGAWMRVICEISCLGGSNPPPDRRSPPPPPPKVGLSWLSLFGAPSWLTVLRNFAYRVCHLRVNRMRSWPHFCSCQIGRS